MASAIRPEVAAARLAREELGVGLTDRCSDILELIEGDAGVPVGVLELPEGFAGVMKRARGRAFIFVNGTEAAVRQRFTLAHEYGHYTLGHGTVFDRTADMFGRDPREVAANAFAAEFLVLRPAVHAWMERRGDPDIDLEVVVRLAAYFGISARAARIPRWRARAYSSAASARSTTRSSKVSTASCSTGSTWPNCRTR